MTRFAELQSRIAQDFERFKNGLPHSLEIYILEAYGVALVSNYGVHPVKNPFGKASGQLSLNAQQIQNDAESGLGFAVLKTLIAEDESGEQSMRAWAIPEAKMKVERIEARRPDAPEREGWTVTWKGRGWSESLEDYLDFFDSAIAIGKGADMLVVPSCKYHLPQPGESEWRQSEYDYTTSKLLDVWRKHHNIAMPIEKDFSPTLAGDAHFSRQRSQILEWLEEAPKRIRQAAKDASIAIGLKIFNAQFDDGFQLEMLSKVNDAKQADFIIYGNRLFDPEKVFEGTAGLAYGGPDLSARNFRVLDGIKLSLPLSATGNILNGRQAFEYLRRGATTFQMHTLFQLPDSEFAIKSGSRTQRALHKLLFDPNDGFLCSLMLAKEEYGWSDGITIPEIARALVEQTTH